MKYKILNIVAHGRIADEINLTNLFNFLSEQLRLPKGKRKISELNDLFDCSKYKKFPGISVRFKDPKINVLIFRSGRIVISGGKSFNDVNLVINKLINILKYLNINIYSKPIIKVNNIVAYANTNKSVNLNKVASALNKIGADVEYDPEQFPSLIIGGKRLKAMIYSSGKIIIVGARSNEEIIDMINKVMTVIGGDSDES